MPGTFPPAFLVWNKSSHEGDLGELSVLIDESGSDGLKYKYYLLILVLHEQDASVSKGIQLYERSPVEKSLLDIPFHVSPLLSGHGGYAVMSLADRKTTSICFQGALLSCSCPLCVQSYRLCISQGCCRLRKCFANGLSTRSGCGLHLRDRAYCSRVRGQSNHGERRKVLWFLVPIQEKASRKCELKEFSLCS